jgi:hypothetical protein
MPTWQSSTPASKLVLQVSLLHHTCTVQGIYLAGLLVLT